MHEIRGLLSPRHESRTSVPPRCLVVTHAGTCARLWPPVGLLKMLENRIEEKMAVLDGDEEDSMSDADTGDAAALCIKCKEPHLTRECPYNRKTALVKRRAYFTKKKADKAAKKAAAADE